MLQPTNKCQSICWRIWKLTLSLLLLHWAVQTGTNATETFGVIIPEHKNIAIAIGDSAKIICTVYNNTLNSSMIWFRKDWGKNAVAIRQPSTNIKILDSKTAELSLYNATRYLGEYFCMVRSSVIDSAKVQVGTPPENVVDFGCRVDNYLKMMCNFTKPENTIYTEYTLSYIFSDSVVPNYKRCQLQPESSRLNALYCNFTAGMYTPMHEGYKLQLTGRNPLGNQTQLFSVNATKIVVPAQVYVQLSNKTSDSITLSWKTSNFLSYEKYGGLAYEIGIRPYDFDWSSKIYYCNKSSCSIPLRKLSYAYYPYEVRIRAKAMTTENEETMWSTPFTVNFTTGERAPERSPHTVANAFYTNENETRLYWQGFEEYEKNGQGFQYVIRHNDNAGMYVTTENSIIVQSSSSGTFYISAKNNLGISPNQSLIQVSPNNFAKDFANHIFALYVYNKEADKYNYKVMWRPPMLQAVELTNYTVFWCLPKALSHTECKNNINFAVVGKDATAFNVPAQQHQIILGVAANFLGISTGIHWSKCIENKAKSLDKLEPIKQAVNGSAISLRWELDRVCPSVLQGYELFYCEIAADDFNICISELNVISISLSDDNREIKDYTITGLKPFSKYRIEMYMYSELKNSSLSEPLYVETAETAPSAPRSLEVYENTVSNSSVNISWLPPAFTNGHLRFYSVYAINSTINSKRNKGISPLEIARLPHISSASAATDVRINYILSDLVSYSDYIIFVTAHTVAESVSSNDANFSTLIGAPSKPLDVKVKDEGDYSVLTWSKPILPAGRLELYEVAFHTRYKDPTSEKFLKKTEISQVLGEQMCRYVAPKCIDPSYSFYIEIRGVNVATREEMRIKPYNTIVSINTKTTAPTTATGNTTSTQPLFSTVKTETTRSRRHTKPVISPNIMSGIQDYKQEIKLTTGATSTILNTSNTTSAELSNRIEKMPPHHAYIINEVSKCENAPYVDPRYFVHLQSGAEEENSDYIFMHSQWQKSSVQINCSEVTSSRWLLYVAFIILSVAMVFFLMYPVYKKLKEMKDIQVRLPDQLNAQLSNSKGGFDNGYPNYIGTIPEPLGRQISEDSLTFGHRESHCLLTNENTRNWSSANMFDLLTSGSKNSQTSSEDQMRSQDCPQILEDSGGNLSNEEMSSQSTDSVELNDVSQCLYQRSPTLPVLAATSDYILAPPITATATAGAIDNGYIVVGNGVQHNANAQETATLTLPTAFPSGPSGYVLPHTVALLSQRGARTTSPVTNALLDSGYSTVDSLTMPQQVAIATAKSQPNLSSQTPIPTLDSSSTSDVTKNKTDEINTVPRASYEILSNNNNNNVNTNKLSNGYVTQRQLSELGHLLH